MSGRLILVRHGQSHGNVDRRLEGTLPVGRRGSRHGRVNAIMRILGLALPIGSRPYKARGIERISEGDDFR